jgi:ATP-dependent HslUV protease, peptidase subunit HslV
LPLVDGDRLTERPGERFIAGLGDVVAILAVERLDMQREPGVLREGLEPLAEQLSVHLPDLRARELDVPHQERASGNVERDAGQRLVHGEIGKAVAGDAALIAERLGHGLAEHDACILGGVVLVDMEIALSLEGDVDQGMAGELLDHVVEEADTGRNVVGAGAVEIDRCRNRGLLGPAGDACPARRACPRAAGVFASLLHGDELNLKALSNSLPSRGPLIRERTEECYQSVNRKLEPALCPPDMAFSMSSYASSPETWHGTTILTVRKNGKVVIAGDGQVSLGQTILKGTAKKVRRVGSGGVIAGFAGSTADAFTLFERLETKLERFPDQLKRACVELAKDWRTDRYLRRLEAMMIVADADESLVLTGTGDVLEPDDAVMGIGSGGAYALAAARALLDGPLDAEAIARKAMAIAAKICVYTNDDITIESLP